MGGVDMAVHLVSGWLFANTVVVLYLGLLYSANRISERVSMRVSARDDARRGQRRAEVLRIDTSRQPHSGRGF
jgi:hypothetical protein